MRVLLDESLPKALGVVFSDHGFDVLDIRSLGFQGAPDETVFRIAQKRKAVLVTADLDFSSALRFPPGRHHGILILRLPSTLTVRAICEEVRRLFRQVKPAQLRRGITIVAPNLIRLRSEHGRFSL